MGKAAAIDREGDKERLALVALYGGKDELDDISLRINYEQTWRRIADMMEACGSGNIEKWTAAKVEYAWNNGVSDRFPEILLPAPWSEQV